MTESELIKGCIKKDKGCQFILFKQYAGVLMTVCFRYSKNHEEAEDLLQDSFIKILLSIHPFRFEGSFEGWMKRIVANHALKMLKKKKFAVININDDEINFAATESFALSNLSETELLKLISSLPDGYRMVFNLYVMEGFPHFEIAEMLGIEVATSRSQLAKARKLLQKQILLNQKIAI